MARSDDFAVSSAAMLKIHLTGHWQRGQVELRWAPSAYVSTPEVDAVIDQEWRAVKHRLADKLFDGPMCRLEAIECRMPAADGRPDIAVVSLDGEPTTLNNRPSTLALSLSRTSYRIFVGTNMTHPEWTDTLGRQVMANTVGVSTALITADGFLMLGRRSDDVAYYPRKLHPFAGSLEPGIDALPPDLFDEAMRELNEELGLGPGEVSEIACIGIVEDLRLRHPEAILYARTLKTKSAIESSLLGHEHTEAWSCPATAEALGAALDDRGQFTPVAQAAVELYKRRLRG